MKLISPIVSILLLTSTALAFPSTSELFPPHIIRNQIAQGAIAMGFVSKEMCSCLFVEKNTRAYCDEYIMIEGMDEINFSVKVDMNKKSVRATTGLVIVKKAKYLDDKRGCSQTQ